MLSKISFAVIICCGLVQAFPKAISSPGYTSLSFPEKLCEYDQVWDSFQKKCKRGYDYQYFSFATDFDVEETTTER